MNDTQEMDVTSADSTKIFLFWFSTAEFVCLIGGQRQQIEVVIPVRKLLFRDIAYNIHLVDLETFFNTCFFICFPFWINNDTQEMDITSADST